MSTLKWFRGSELCQRFPGIADYPPNSGMREGLETYSASSRLVWLSSSTPAPSRFRRADCRLGLLRQAVLSRCAHTATPLPSIALLAPCCPTRLRIALDRSGYPHRGGSPADPTWLARQLFD